MLKGFKEFILRGNVIDLAVAVVIGAAFTGIVNALVTGIFNPVIALLFNAESLAKVGVVLRDNPGDEPDIILAWGLVLSSIIQFLLVAAVVYFALIMPINYLKRVAFKKREEEDASAKPAPPTELELLAEIRDLLKRDAATEHGKHTEV